MQIDKYNPNKGPKGMQTLEVIIPTFKEYLKNQIENTVLYALRKFSNVLPFYKIKNGSILRILQALRASPRLRLQFSHWVRQEETQALLKGVVIEQVTRVMQDPVNLSLVQAWDYYQSHSVVQPQIETVRFVNTDQKTQPRVSRKALGLR